jgi:hypothetical protein
MTWYWVDLPYACYGIRVEDAVVVEAAPIAGWMRGKSENYVIGWLHQKGATIMELAR